MDLYLKVRQAHFQDGLSGRQIVRDFGVGRDRVARMLAYSEPPGYRRKGLSQGGQAASERLWWSSISLRLAAAGVLESSTTV